MKQKPKTETKVKPLTKDEINRNQGMFKTKGKLLKALMREKRGEMNKTNTNIKALQHKIEFFQENILKWYKDNKRSFPWRKKGLTAYQLIIAEILLNLRFNNIGSDCAVGSKVKILAVDISPAGIYINNPAGCIHRHVLHSPRNSRSAEWAGSIIGHNSPLDNAPGHGWKVFGRDF